jgi:hypothetical protein
MGRRELLDAEREVLDLEDELAAAKEYGAAEMELKLRLREARRAFRLLREGEDPGEGVVRPATVNASAGVA